jgi:hypothetical protein
MIMIAGRTYTFSGDKGKHTDDQGQDCPGRSFYAKMVGVGGIYINTVECTTCNKELKAGEDSLLLQHP